MSGTLAIDIALLGLVLWLCVRGPLLVAERPRDAIVFGVLFGVALVVQMRVPWGPLDFAETERLHPLWTGRDQEMEEAFSAIVRSLCTLRDFDFSWVAVVRWCGPILSALGVALVYACGRAGGLDEAPSVLGALILLTWPAHLRYGVSSLAMAGPAAFTGAYAAALARSIPPTWKVLLVALCTVVGVHCRPELVVLVAPLLPLVFSDGWRWRDRIALGALLVLGLTAHGLALLRQGTTHAGYPWDLFWHSLFYDPAFNPSWWLVAAVLGVLVGRVRLPLRACLLLAIALLSVAYVRFASEENPLWGVWRTVVAITPFLALGAASLVNRIPARVRLGASVLIALATVAASWHFAPIVLRAQDSQAEFAYVLESTARIAAAHPDLLVITTADLPADDFQQEGTHGVPFESNIREAVAAATGRSDAPVRCNTFPRLEPPRLWSLEILTGDCPGRLEPAGAAIYLGLFRPEHLLAKLESRYRLEPIEERHISAAPSLQMVNSTCVYPIGTLIGSTLPDCALTLGWYRITPR